MILRIELLIKFSINYSEIVALRIFINVMIHTIVNGRKIIANMLASSNCTTKKTRPTARSQFENSLVL